jgi:hypothetical protein
MSLIDGCDVQAASTCPGALADSNGCPKHHHSTFRNRIILLTSNASHFICPHKPIKLDLRSRIQPLILFWNIDRSVSTLIDESGRSLVDGQHKGLGDVAKPRKSDQWPIDERWNLQHAHMRFPAGCPDNILRNILSSKRLHSFVHLLGSRLVSSESSDRESCDIIQIVNNGSLFIA